MTLIILVAVAAAIMLAGIADVLRLGRERFAAAGRRRSDWILLFVFIGPPAVLLYAAAVRPQVAHPQRYVDDPADAPARAPAHDSAEASTCAPAGAPAGAPADAPARAPARACAEASACDSTHGSTHAQAEAPPSDSAGDLGRAAAGGHQ